MWQYNETNKNNMSGYLSTSKKKITAPLFFEMKRNGEKISWLTAYDYTTASIMTLAEWTQSLLAIQLLT